jgi:uncharacterized protein (DUF1684 family)
LQHAARRSVIMIGTARTDQHDASSASPASPSGSRSSAANWSTARPPMVTSCWRHRAGTLVTAPIRVLLVDDDALVRADKAHVSRLLTKLDADNRVQIALLVQEATADRPWVRVRPRPAGRRGR